MNTDILKFSYEEKLKCHSYTYTCVVSYTLKV